MNKTLRKMFVFPVDLEDRLKTNVTKQVDVAEIKEGDKILVKVGNYEEGKPLTDWNWYEGYVKTIPNQDSRAIAISPTQEAHTKKLTRQAKFNIDYFHAPFCAEVHKYQ